MSVRLVNQAAIVTESARTPAPTEINLHRNSKVLEVSFDDGARFELPCQYLRVFSPSAETRVAERRGEPVLGKENVNITRIDPVGTYAVKIAFDDGHDTGIYSWDTLYELGRDRRENWEQYQARARSREEKLAAERNSGDGAGAKVKVRYFERLVDRMGRESEDIALPGPLPDVRALLAALIARDPPLGNTLSEEQVKVTVNKQLADPQTRLRDGDEVAVVPIRPVV